MQKVFKAYMDRPWPTKKRRSSTDKNLPRCGLDCTCKLYAECQQNAAAYISAAEYTKNHPEAVDNFFSLPKGMKRPTTHCPKKHQCAATGSNHRVCPAQLFVFVYKYIFISIFVEISIYFRSIITIVVNLEMHHVILAMNVFLIARKIGLIEDASPNVVQMVMLTLKK